MSLELTVFLTLWSPFEDPQKRYKYQFSHLFFLVLPYSSTYCISQKTHQRQTNTTLNLDHVIGAGGLNVRKCIILSSIVKC